MSVLPSHAASNLAAEEHLQDNTYHNQRAPDFWIGNSPVGKRLFLGPN